MDEDFMVLIEVFKVCIRGLVFIEYGAKAKYPKSLAFALVSCDVTLRESFGRPVDAPTLMRKTKGLFACRPHSTKPNLQRCQSRGG